MEQRLREGLRFSIYSEAEAKELVADWMRFIGEEKAQERFLGFGSRH